MQELITEPKTTLPCAAHLKSIWEMEVGQLVHLQEVKYIDCVPKRHMRGSRWRSVRPVVLGIIYDPAFRMLVVVQDAKAAHGQLAPIQGGVERRENIYQALRRELREESGLDVNQDDMRYVASALCPMPKGRLKGGRFSFQLFHCLIGYVRNIDKAELRQCDETGSFATLLHYRNFWPTVAERASPTKQSLLKQVLEEAMRRQLIDEMSLR